MVITLFYYPDWGFLTCLYYNVPELDQNNCQFFQSLFPFLTDSNDLEVRLSDGNFEGEGYVEMRCPGQKWSTVCVQDWDMRDADTVCRQLGYPWAYSTSPDGEPGVTLGEIAYSKFLCTGNETYIGECAFTQ